MDNQALFAALEAAEQVIPVFILDPILTRSPYKSEKRQAFLLANLGKLDAGLRTAGSQLIIREGNPGMVLAELLLEFQAQIIFAEPDYSPYARQRDQKITDTLPILWVGSPSFRPPGSVLRADGGAYTVFTPFSKAWKSLPLPSTSEVLPKPKKIPSPSGLTEHQPTALTDISDLTLFPPGEEEAQRRLNKFCYSDAAKIESYSDLRNRLDLEGTSKLSPYLRFGVISARQAVVAALEALEAAPDQLSRKSAETWLNELIWREFYIHILYHFPQVRAENFRLANIAWRNNPKEFEAWCTGCTGYPGVDAAMRELVRTGWMHNRARMIVASFLTKDLLIDWRWGEKFFMQHLVDGDPAANNGGWQWTAGTGTDAAPYFRVFNPVTQSKKYDPDGIAIRRWLPELKNVPTEFIHEPWDMSQVQQQAYGCILGKDYPAAMIDHNWARQRVLQVYGKGK